jgi:hypothetical protein
MPGICAMKTRPAYCLTGLLFAFSLLFSGCGAKKTKLDTTAFDKAFQTAPAEFQTLAPKASKAFKNGSFEEGANTLAEIARKSGVTEEQKEAMRSLIITAQTIMAEQPEKASLNAHQAFNNATAAIEGRPAMPVGVAPSSLPKQ